MIVKRKGRLGVMAESSTGLYRIAEIVTPQGHYITHFELYRTADAAYDRIKQILRKESDEPEELEEDDLLGS